MFKEKVQEKQAEAAREEQKRWFATFPNVRTSE
jgi:hypothetical protein